MLNALTAMSARERGGTFGLGVDAGGNLRESCVLNVVVISSDGVMRTPPFKRILAGTTVRRVMDLTRERLIQKGTVSRVVQDEIKLYAPCLGLCQRPMRVPRMYGEDEWP